MLMTNFPVWPMRRTPMPAIGLPLHLHDNVDALYDRAVKAGCKVEMPLQNQFWGDRYGKVRDLFGHSGDSARHAEDVTARGDAATLGSMIAQMSKAASGDLIRFLTACCIGCALPHPGSGHFFGSEVSPTSLRREPSKPSSKSVTELLPLVLVNHVKVEC